MQLWTKAIVNWEEPSTTNWHCTSRFASALLRLQSGGKEEQGWKKKKAGAQQVKKIKNRISVLIWEEGIFDFSNFARFANFALDKKRFCAKKPLFGSIKLCNKK